MIAKFQNLIFFFDFYGCPGSLNAQAGSEIKKWEITLNDDCPRDQKEPFLISKNGEKRREKIMGP